MIRGDHSDAFQTHTRVRVRLRPCMALAAAATLHAETTPEPPTETETETAPPQIDQWQIQQKIDKYRHETWRWQRMMGRRLTRSLKDPPGGGRREDRGLEARRGQDAGYRPESAPQAAVALHPPLRRLVDRPEPAVLRRPADGSRVPAHLRPRAALTQRDGGPLDAARADVGCRASAPCRPRVLPLAEHGALLRSDLAQTLDVVVCVDVREVPVTV